MDSKVETKLKEILTDLKDKGVIESVEVEVSDGPVGPPQGGGFIYVQNRDLFYMDSFGTPFLLAKGGRKKRDYEKDILDALKDGPLNVPTLKALMKCSDSQYYFFIKKLTNEGKVNRVVDGRYVTYELSKEGVSK